MRYSSIPEAWPGPWPGPDAYRCGASRLSVSTSYVASPLQFDHKCPRVHQPPEDYLALRRLRLCKELRKRQQFVSRERFAVRGVVGPSNYVERHQDRCHALCFVAAVEGAESVVQVAIKTRQDVLNRIVRCGLFPTRVPSVLSSLARSNSSSG